MKQIRDIDTEVIRMVEMTNFPHKLYKFFTNGEWCLITLCKTREFRRILESSLFQIASFTFSNVSISKYYITRTVKLSSIQFELYNIFDYRDKRCSLYYISYTFVSLARIVDSSGINK